MILLLANSLLAGVMSANLLPVKLLSLKRLLGHLTFGKMTFGQVTLNLFYIATAKRKLAKQTSAEKKFDPIWWKKSFLKLRSEDPETHLFLFPSDKGTIFFVSFAETNVAVVEQFQTHNFINQLRLSCCSHGSSVGKASRNKVPQRGASEPMWVWFPVAA